MTRREFLIRVGQTGAAVALTQVLPWPDPTTLGVTTLPGPTTFTHDGYYCWWTGWHHEAAAHLMTGAWMTIGSSRQGHGQILGHELRACLSAMELERSAVHFDLATAAREQARIKFVEYLDGLGSGSQAPPRPAGSAAVRTGTEVAA